VTPLVPSVFSFGLDADIGPVGVTHTAAEGLSRLRRHRRIDDLYLGRDLR
jgi:hypothetical protein